MEERSRAGSFFPPFLRRLAENLRRKADHTPEAAGKTGLDEMKKLGYDIKNGYNKKLNFKKYMK